MLLPIMLLLEVHGRYLMAPRLETASFSMERIANPSMKYRCRAPETNPFPDK